MLQAGGEVVLGRRTGTVGAQQGQPWAQLLLRAQAASARSTSSAACFLKGLSPLSILVLEAAVGGGLMGDRITQPVVWSPVFSCGLAFCLK